MAKIPKTLFITIKAPLYMASGPGTGVEKSDVPCRFRASALDLEPARRSKASKALNQQALNPKP